MSLNTEPFLEQNARWPAAGRHILAQFDTESVVVYQAYAPPIGRFAASHGYFGGEFSYSRMSWIKPNFLWMMYRSGWGAKPGQEVVLAVRLRREFFDSLLMQAVPSTFVSGLYADATEWKRAVRRSGVRLQWDPDHGPKGQPLQRRAIQLGLRGDVLEEYGKRAILEIQDLSGFVAEQRQRVQLGDLEALLTPSETVYAPADPEIARRLGLADPSVGVPG
jgi:hypothetical protein